MLMIVAYPLQLKKVEFPEHFQVSPLCLQKLETKKYQKKIWQNLNLFKKFSQAVLFGKMVLLEKPFNGYDTYVHIPAKLVAHSLKVSSHSDRICRSDDVKVIKKEKNYYN